jgi:hypothetical protein
MLLTKTAGIQIYVYLKYLKISKTILITAMACVAIIYSIFSPICHLKSFCEKLFLKCDIPITIILQDLVESILSVLRVQKVMCKSKKQSSQKVKSKTGDNKITSFFTPVAKLHWSLNLNWSHHQTWMSQKVMSVLVCTVMRNQNNLMVNFNMVLSKCLFISLSCICFIL